MRIADVLLLKKDLDGVSCCDKKTLQILAVIELDDKSHRQLKTIERDIFVQNVCKNSGLSLIRFDAKSDYHIQSVRDKVINSIHPFNMLFSNLKNHYWYIRCTRNKSVRRRYYRYVAVEKTPG